MLVDYVALDEGYTPVWTCLGCGRSVSLDDARRAEDERIMQQIMRTLREHPPSEPP
jgi:hypothetical protein